MNTKTLATSIVFTAITVALNPAVSGIAIPAPYAPYLLYQIWEIPIVTAFVLLSRKVAVTISVLNAVLLAAFFPGALPMGSVYNLIAILSTILGIYIVQLRIKESDSIIAKFSSDDYTKTRFVLFSTTLAIILRVVVMTIVNYLVLGLPYPFGFQVDELAIIASLPLTGLFNATLTLYTVPLGLFVARAISRNLSLQNN